MGSSASKAAQSSTRKYPGSAGRLTHPPPSRPAPATGNNHRRPGPRPSRPEDDGRADSVDPSRQVDAAFSDRLRQIGIVQPNPTLSNSSTAAGPAPAPGQRHQPAPQNTTLSVLEARQRLQRQADAELEAAGLPSHGGREFLDVATIREVLVLRSRGVKPSDIEARLRLRQGVVARLGPEGFLRVLGGAES